MKDSSSCLNGFTEILTTLGLIFLITVIPLTVKLITQRQETRKIAAEICSPAECYSDEDCGDPATMTCANGCCRQKPGGCGTAVCGGCGGAACGQTGTRSCHDNCQTWTEDCDMPGCPCQKQCSGATCNVGAPDGCGGTCVTGDGCCTPDCSGKQCGNNGCGGSCGVCSDGATCDQSSGQCIIINPPGSPPPQNECATVDDCPPNSSGCLATGCTGAPRTCRYPSSCSLNPTPQPTPTPPLLSCDYSLCPNGCSGGTTCLPYCNPSCQFGCSSQSPSGGICNLAPSPSPTSSPTLPPGPINCPFKSMSDCEASGCAAEDCDNCADNTFNCFGKLPSCPYKNMEDCELSGCPQRNGEFRGGCSYCLQGNVKCTQTLTQCSNQNPKTDSYGCSYVCSNNYWQKENPDCECNFDGIIPSFNYDRASWADMCTNQKITNIECLDGTLYFMSNSQNIAQTKCPSGKCYAGTCIFSDNFCCKNNSSVCENDKQSIDGLRVLEKCLNDSCINGYCQTSLPEKCKPTIMKDGCTYDCIPLLGQDQQPFTLIFQKNDPGCPYIQQVDDVCKNQDVYKVTYSIINGQKTKKENFIGRCPHGCSQGKCIEPIDSPCKWNPWFNSYIDANNNLIACIADKDTSESSWQKINIPIKVSLPKGLTSSQKLDIYKNLYKLYSAPLGQKIDTRELVIFDEVKNLAGFDDPRYKVNDRKISGGKNYPDTKIATLENYNLDGIFHELAHGINDCGQRCYEMTNKWKQETGWLEPNPYNSGTVNNPPSDVASEYAKTNPDEDIAESIMYFMINPTLLQKVSPRRYDFIKKYWNDGQDAPDLIKPQNKSGVDNIFPPPTDSGEGISDYKNEITVLWSNHSLNAYKDIQILNEWIESGSLLPGERMIVHNYFDHDVEVSSVIIPKGQEKEIIYSKK